MTGRCRPFRGQVPRGILSIRRWKFTEYAKKVLKGRCPVMQPSTDRTMKGGGAGMQSLETQRAVRTCPGGRTERGQDQVAAAVELLRQDQVFQGKEAPRPVTAGCGWGVFGGEIWGCGQCPHFGSRTGPCRRRTGSDCGGFRGSGGNVRARTRFESHLWHSVSAGQGLFGAFFVWTVSTLSPLI